MSRDSREPKLTPLQALRVDPRPPLGSSLTTRAQRMTFLRTPLGSSLDDWKPPRSSWPSRSRLPPGSRRLRPGIPERAVRRIRRPHSRGQSRPAMILRLPKVREAGSRGRRKTTATRRPRSTSSRSTRLVRVVTTCCCDSLLHLPN